MMEPSKSSQSGMYPNPVRKSEGQKLGNRERILTASIDLFNQAGVVAITTNHIAAHLTISPGNLYFHFRNKEEIVRELFQRMCDATYAVWIPKAELPGSQNSPASPLELIERSFEVFWKYRFFHREMYHLRRRDPLLAKKWRLHMARTMKLLQAMYNQWVSAGVLREVKSAEEMQMISDTVLISSSSFLQFFESPEKPATRKSLTPGIQHLITFLRPYHTEAYQPVLRESGKRFLTAVSQL